MLSWVNTIHTSYMIPSKERTSHEKPIYDKSGYTSIHVNFQLVRDTKMKLSHLKKKV